MVRNNKGLHYFVMLMETMCSFSSSSAKLTVQYVVTFFLFYYCMIIIIIMYCIIHFPTYLQIRLKDKLMELISFAIWGPPVLCNDEAECDIALTVLPVNIFHHK